VNEKMNGKIFPPFFTMKPTGQEAVLVFSSSYDIIKAHAGEIKVETRKEKVQHLSFNYLIIHHHETLLKNIITCFIPIDGACTARLF
jgi:hypothetical protein